MAKWKRLVKGDGGAMEEVEADDPVSPERLNDSESATPDKLPAFDNPLKKEETAPGKWERPLKAPLYVLVGRLNKPARVVGLELYAPRRAARGGQGVREPGETLYQVVRYDPRTGEDIDGVATLPGTAVMLMPVPPVAVSQEG